MQEQRILWGRAGSKRRRRRTTNSCGGDAGYVCNLEWHRTGTKKKKERREEEVKIKSEFRASFRIGQRNSNSGLVSEGASRCRKAFRAFTNSSTMQLCWVKEEDGGEGVKERWSVVLLFPFGKNASRLFFSFSLLLY
jgi:hypothetical protein